MPSLRQVDHGGLLHANQLTRLARLVLRIDGSQLLRLIGKLYRAQLESLRHYFPLVCALTFLKQARSRFLGLLRGSEFLTA